MQIHNFNDHNSLYKSFLAELRDIEIQKDAMRFRKNVERCGEISAYEISKEMHFTIKSVKTVLGAAETNIMSEQPVIVSVLRAGLPLQQGVLNYFDKAENGFISAFRKHSSPFKFDIDISYLACSNLENKTLILCDPMLATGASLHLAYQALLKKGYESLKNYKINFNDDYILELVAELWYKYGAQLYSLKEYITYKMSVFCSDSCVKQFDKIDINIIKQLYSNNSSNNLSNSLNKNSYKDNSKVSANEAQNYTRQPLRKPSVSAFMVSRNFKTSASNQDEQSKKLFSFFF